MGKNEYAKQIQARKKLEAEIYQRWSTQLCMDVMTLALNDPEIMGKDTFGRERLTRLNEGFNRIYDEAAIALTTRPEASYARAKIDERLMRINGEDFSPWSDRYYLWDDKGI